MAGPGETVALAGRHFGTSGRLEVENTRVNPDAIRSWNDNLVVFTVPASIRSGMLRIRTEVGPSNAVFFINNTDLPDAAAQTLPVVTSASSINFSPGARIALYGSGFGTRHADSVMRLEAAETGEVLELPGDSFWIQRWSDRLIRLIIPPETPAGTLTMTLNQREIPVRFTGSGPTGVLVQGDSRYYRVTQAVTAEVADPDARIVLLRLPQHRAQPSVEKTGSSRAVPEETRREATAGWIYRLPPGAPPTASEDAPETQPLQHVDLVERRTLRWEFGTVAPTQVLLEGDFIAAFSRYLTGDDGVPVNNAAVDQLRRSQVNLRNTIPVIAGRIHAVVQQTLTPDPDGTVDLASALAGEPAGPRVYADLAVALLRISGLPARRHAGFLLTDTDEPRPHFWAEAFFPGLGWVPLDPALGDGMYLQETQSLSQFYGENRSAATFGGIDDRRITLFMDGLADVRVYPRGRATENQVVPGVFQRLELPRLSPEPDPPEVRWHRVEVLN